MLSSQLFTPAKFPAFKDIFWTNAVLLPSTCDLIALLKRATGDWHAQRVHVTRLKNNRGGQRDINCECPELRK